MRIVGLFVFAGGLVALTACSKSIEGRWKGTCETEDEGGADYDYDVDLELEQSGDEIEGSSDWESDDNEFDGDVSGDRNGDDFDLEIEADGDFGDGEIQLSLKLEDGNLVGDVDIDWEQFNKEDGDCEFEPKK